MNYFRISLKWFRCRDALKISYKIVWMCYWQISYYMDYVNELSIMLRLIWILNDFSFMMHWKSRKRIRLCGTFHCLFSSVYFVSSYKNRCLWECLNGFSTRTDTQIYRVSWVTFRHCIFLILSILDIVL